MAKVVVRIVTSFEFVVPETVLELELIGGGREFVCTTPEKVFPFHEGDLHTFGSKKAALAFCKAHNGKAEIVKGAP